MKRPANTHYISEYWQVFFNVSFLHAIPLHTCQEVGLLFSYHLLLFQDAKHKCGELSFRLK